MERLYEEHEVLKLEGAMLAIHVTNKRGGPKMYKSSYKTLRRKISSPIENSAEFFIRLFKTGITNGQ